MNYVKLFLAATLVFGFMVIAATAQNSVLHEGNWYKLSTTENGIYKISYSDLQSYGINPAEINPKTIRIFGNGNGMLPEDPAAFRYDDLQENSIFVYGEEDEVFDPEDYILFYGEGPTEWNLDAATGYFEHETNLYSNEVCYFFNYGMAEGKRIETQYSTIIPETYTSTSFNAYFTHDVDSLNLIKSGKKWFGEIFNENTQYNFNEQLPGVIVTDSVLISVSAAGKSTEISQLSCSVNGQDEFNLVFPEIVFGGTMYARENKILSGLYLNNDQADINFTYNKPNDSSIAWLDYFTLNYRSNLSFTNEALIFRDLETVGSNNVTKFELQTSDENIQIWNITNSLDAKTVDFQYATGLASFTLETDSLLEFIAFNDQQYLSPGFEGVVPNQNLHGLNPVNLVIIAPEEFMAKAQELALYRQNNDNLTTLVVTPGLIYNEFSSGVQDVSAIRDFTKHMYEKDPDNGLKYLLLFGKASYDYKDRLDYNTNYVPVWESEESLNTVNAYCTDDFYGLFGWSYPSLIDICISRIPVTDESEGTQVIQKLIDYDSFLSAMGDWMNRISFIADDEDDNLHLNITETLAQIADTANASMNLNKIYLDAYSQEVNASGLPVYPEVNSLIKQKIAEGVLLMVYTGHGDFNKLAYEAVFTPEDIDDLANDSNFPLMINASGGVNKFDDPSIISLGEQMFLCDQKGMIGVFSPTGPTYAAVNSQVSKMMLYRILTEKETRIGDLIREVKSNPIFYNQKFAFFGDPTMKLAIPELNVETETINGIPASSFTDTLNPGMQVNLAGKITDENGSLVLDFDGDITIKIYDRPEIKTTLGNDPSSPITEFMTQETVIAEITTTVSGGAFDATFTLPAILDSDFGPIKLSYYAASDMTDAQGQYAEIIVGGPYNAVEEQSVYNSVEVYPTFVQDKINIEVMEDISHLHLELLDLSGKTMQLEEKYQIRSGERLTMNVSGIKKGLYILRLSLDEGTIQYKIVKK